jgi:kynureninase
METAIAGWMGHASPFNFELHYRPAAGVQRQLAGTPSIVALAALEAAIDLWLEVDRDAVWRKSRALGDLFIKLVDEAGLEGIDVASPRQAARRGSQVSLRHEQGYAVTRALIDRGVIGDFRVPDILRFGLTPLYTRYVDVYDAVAALRDVIDSRQWDRPAYRTRLAVT